MQVRKKFRRVKRFVYLGAITGTVVTVRRQRARKAAGPALGAPASWPPLESSKEAPVAASGSWADGAATPAPTVEEPSAAVPVAAAPTAAVGALVDDADAALAQAGGDETAVDEDGVAAAESGAADEGTSASGTAGQAWVAPTDGACPSSHPVKANANSGIFHLPGGRFYERTQAERCYVDATAAEADGYRAAKEH